MQKFVAKAVVQCHIVVVAKQKYVLSNSRYRYRIKIRGSSSATMFLVQYCGSGSVVLRIQSAFFKHCEAYQL